jgi:hypothetical protein
MTIRVRLLSTDDPYTDLVPGSLGTKTYEQLDPWGAINIGVKWDNGSSLKLISGEDAWEEFTEPDH